jgi:GR25 family glycosyltransferase involved in LPS biosynthesis
LKQSANAKFFRKIMDHIFIINLVHRQDRRDHMEHQMKLLGVPTSQFTFSEATDRSWSSQKSALVSLGHPSPSQALPRRGVIGPKTKTALAKHETLVKPFLSVEGSVYRRIRSARKSERDKGLAEFAVSLSHARVWHAIAQEDNDRYYLILEDDACLANTFRHSDFESLLRQAFQEFPNRGLILLGYCYPQASTVLIQGEHNALEEGSYYCSHSYMITPHMARVLLSLLFPVAEAVDVWFSNRMVMRYSLTFKQPIFNQSDEQGAVSDIQLEEDTRGEMSNVANMKFGNCYVE